MLLSKRIGYWAWSKANLATSANAPHIAGSISSPRTWTGEKKRSVKILHPGAPMFTEHGVWAPGGWDGALLSYSTFVPAGRLPAWKPNCNRLSRIMNSTAIAQPDFDSILVSELEILHEGEERLKRLYPQLPKKPHLRDFFLSELSVVKQRAQRLHAILNPYEAFEPVAADFSAPQMRPAA
jgi:hypothetical protein